eukprot:UN02473
MMVCCVFFLFLFLFCFCFVIFVFYGLHSVHKRILYSPNEILSEQRRQTEFPQSLQCLFG